MSEKYTRGIAGVVRGSDGACIPADETNADWRAFLAWEAAGNTPSLAPASPFGAAAPAEVPLWALRAAIKEANGFLAIDAFVEQHKDDMPALWEAWNMGNTVSVNSMLVASFASQFGIDSAARDALMRKAAAISAGA